MIKDKTNILDRLALMAWNHDGEDNKTLMDAISIISNQQEIVHCKDCDNKECWGRAGDVVCGIDGTPHRPDWFCADGEARE